MDVLSPFYVFVGFGIACLIKIRSKQYEHAFSRLIVCLWYFYLWSNPEIPIETQRLVGRWSIMQVAFIEMLSFFVRGWFNRKYKNALKVGTYVK